MFITINFIEVDEITDTRRITNVIMRFTIQSILWCEYQLLLLELIFSNVAFYHNNMLCEL